MDKKAKSTDPQQQKLRDHKKNLNMAISEFISRMIALKRGLNGRGDPRYNLNPGKIQDPLPESVSSLLNELTSNFQQLADEALKIVQEQAYYSEHRRKPMQKDNAPPTEIMPSPVNVVSKVRDGGLVSLAEQLNKKWVK